MQAALQHLRSPRGLQVAAGVMFVAVAIAAFATTSQLRHGVSHASQANALLGPSPPPFGVDPFPNGQAMSLANAGTAAGFHIPQPSVAGLATPSTLGNVWYAHTPIDGGPQENRQIALYYPSAQIEITMWPSQMSDPADGFAQIASGWGDPPTVLQTVDGGLPALVYDQNSDATGQNTGSVTFVLNGLYIEVLGHLASSDLKQVAGSME